MSDDTGSRKQEKGGFDQALAQLGRCLEETNRNFNGYIPRFSAYEKIKANHHKQVAVITALYRETLEAAKECVRLAREGS